MNVRPIIFSAPMILALLAGRKTTTRRLVPKKRDSIFHYGFDDSFVLDPENADWLQCSIQYAAGDLLYVRETCHAEEPQGAYGGVRYHADDAFVQARIGLEAAVAWIDLHNYRKQRGATVPPIHMPRWASRITLEVTAVKVERLQDISEADAIDEGALLIDLPAHGTPEELGQPPLGASPRDRFAHLWRTLHGKDAWAENPFVVAPAFTVHRCNVDSFLGKLKAAA